MHIMFKFFYNIAGYAVLYALRDEKTEAAMKKYIAETCIYCGGSEIVFI